MYKNIIFDVDETLVETFKARDELFEFITKKNLGEFSAEVLRLCFRRHTIEEIKVFEGEEFMTLGINPNDIFFHSHLENYMDKKVAEELKYRILEKTFSELGLDYNIELAGTILQDLKERWLDYFKPITGTKEVLEKLQGYKLYVLTDGFNEVQLARVDKCDLRKYFHRAYASEELGIGKESELAFTRLMEKEKLMPYETIMIGDNIKTDYNAHRVGITALLFDRYKNCKGESIKKISALEEVFAYLKPLDS